MIGTQRLPDGFEVLEPFVDFWAVHGTATRDARRTASSEAQRKAFYQIAKDHVPRALEELDRTPLGQLDEKQTTLMNLLLSFAHVVNAVELLGQGEAKHAQFRAAMPFIRSTADLPA
jgi:IS4 transposase